MMQHRHPDRDAAGATEPAARLGRLAFRLPTTLGAGHDRRGIFAVADIGHAQPALAYAPTGAEVRDPLRLVLLLHGAGGSAQQGLELLRPVADEHRLLLVAPTSHDATWDVIAGRYGPDVRVIDQLLDEVSGSFPVRSLTIGGFSDGASYALSLGITNGEIFDSVIAFSPGFAAPTVGHGDPRIYVSHGTADQVLPIDRCSRRLVPQLRQSGYDVRYDEFDDGHALPDHIVRAAMTWLRSAEK